MNLLKGNIYKRAALDGALGYLGKGKEQNRSGQQRFVLHPFLDLGVMIVLNIMRFYSVIMLLIWKSIILSGIFLEVTKNYLC